jgi:orotate phosphoribosyltransferase
LSEGEAAASRAADLHAMLEASEALLSGHFLLSSGLHSPRYVQCARLLEHPVRARRVGEALAAELRPFGVESVLAPAMGGLIIGHETAAALGVPFRFTERKDGRMELRRGFALRPGERVAIVEDVVTTGKSTEETMAVARAQGATVVAVGSILDRTAGGEPFAVPFASLLALEFPVWPAAECPLCAEGGAPEKPGSREPTGTT